MKLITKILFSLLAFFSIFGCNRLTTQNIYLNGPESWGEKCKKGKFQSPINIIDGKNTINSENYIKINYRMPPSLEKDQLFFDGDKLSLNIKLGTIEYYDFQSNSHQTFEVNKLELHLPSEHFLTREGNTQRYILELQIHHKLISQKEILVSKTNKINVKTAIIAVLFEIGSLKEGDKFFNSMGISKYNLNKEGELVIPKKDQYLGHVLIPPASYRPGFSYTAFQGLINLLSAESSMFFYYGSSNNPPCDENVSWMIFREPRSISNEQFEYLKKILVSVDEKKKLIGNNRKLNIYDAIKRGKIRFNHFGMREIKYGNLYSKALFQK